MDAKHILERVASLKREMRNLQVVNTRLDQPRSSKGGYEARLSRLEQIVMELAAMLDEFKRTRTEIGDSPLPLQILPCSFQFCVQLLMRDRWAADGSKFQEKVCGAGRQGARLSHLPLPTLLYSVYVLVALTLGKYGAIDRSADPKGKLQLTVF